MKPRTMWLSRNGEWHNDRCGQRPGSDESITLWNNEPAIDHDLLTKRGAVQYWRGDNVICFCPDEFAAITGIYVDYGELVQVAITKKPGYSSMRVVDRWRWHPPR